MSDQVEKSPGRPKRLDPVEVLMRTGVFKTLPGVEQRFLFCLDSHYNRITGLCFPSEKRIHEETGLSYSSIYTARKAIRGRFIEYELKKHKGRGQPVYHYRWINIPSDSRDNPLAPRASLPPDAIPGEFPAPFQGQPPRSPNQTPSLGERKPELNLKIKKTLIESHKSPEKEKDKKPPAKAVRSLTEYVNSVTLAGETRLTPANIMKFIKATEAEVAAEELQTARRESMDRIANKKLKAKKCPWRL